MGPEDRCRVLTLCRGCRLGKEMPAPLTRRLGGKGRTLRVAALGDVVKRVPGPLTAGGDGAGERSRAKGGGATAAEDDCSAGGEERPCSGQIRSATRMRRTEFAQAFSYKRFMLSHDSQPRRQGSPSRGMGLAEVAGRWKNVNHGLMLWRESSAVKYRLRVFCHRSAGDE